MRDEQLFQMDGSVFGRRLEGATLNPNVTRQTLIGLLLIVALFAFEVFNFDTTRYALTNLLGNVTFAGFPWAAILAVAFCAIDFAGLAHLFAPAEERSEHKESWYLMGAWLLGATMNALMTWWAVNLTLLNNQLGNEVLSRQQILEVVPPFVAVLVWLTRILFIGAFSVAGEHFFKSAEEADEDQANAISTQPAREMTGPYAHTPATTPTPRTASNTAAKTPKREVAPEKPQRRVRQRPPMPHTVRPAPMQMSARQRYRHS